MGSLLNDREKKLFDDRNVEVLRLAGAEDVILWSKTTNQYTLPEILFGNSASGIDGLDCLYGEANPVVADAVEGKQHGYYRQYQILGLFEEPAISFDVTVLGAEEVADVIWWVSRRIVEAAKVPRDGSGDYIKSGDIIQAFSKDKTETTYYEVINSNRTGYVHDSKTFTQYRLDCVRSSAFKPERKIP